MYMLTTANPPSQAVVKSVMTKVGMLPTGVNKNWGFPFTTGQIIVRGTGKTPGGKAGGGGTLTAKGFDQAATMITGIGVPVPGGRQLQLVAGGVAQSNIQGPNGTPSYTIIRLPEPRRSLQMLAGVLCLLGVAICRGRKRRIGIV